jgi:hypothetical protein
VGHELPPVILNAFEIRQYRRFFALNWLECVIEKFERQSEFGAFCCLFRTFPLGSVAFPKASLGFAPGTFRADREGAGAMCITMRPEGIG